MAADHSVEYLVAKSVVRQPWDSSGAARRHANRCASLGLIQSAVGVVFRITFWQFGKERVGEQTY